jgi:hypothetical protein
LLEHASQVFVKEPGVGDQELVVLAEMTPRSVVDGVVLESPSLCSPLWPHLRNFVLENGRIKPLRDYKEALSQETLWLSGDESHGRGPPVTSVNIAHRA